MGARIAVESGLELALQRGPLPGVLAHEQRREMIAHRYQEAVERIAGHGRRGGRFAPADAAVGRFDPHQDVQRAAHGDAGHRHRLLQRQADWHGVDAANDQRRTVAHMILAMGDLDFHLTTLFEHDLFGKPLHTFPDHALALAAHPRHHDELPGRWHRPDRDLDQGRDIAARERALERSAQLLRIACALGLGAEALRVAYEIGIGEVARDQAVAVGLFLDAPDIAEGAVVEHDHGERDAVAHRGGELVRREQEAAVA